VFDHVGIWVSDRDASERFYDTVLAVLGIERTYTGDDFTEWNDFALGQGGGERQVTTRLHLGFFARSRDLVDEFWRVGTEAGYRDDGPPGLRPEYSEDYYGGFLLDPDGNSAEAVHHGIPHRSGIDHLWMRVADVGAAKHFYELVGPHAGFALRRDTPERASFASVGGTFSVVAGPPTEYVHIAFGVDDNAAVDEFHRSLTGAGYADNGAPGERAIYHPGYYGAFVLDPDGNNIELVNHNR
jgi:catechol 2,3-dioxygenase-like lactoylglutathione lyase family enzyme